MLRHVTGADPRHELGGITEVAAGLPECPALLFDNIRDYPAGFRVFTNATTVGRTDWSGFAESIVGSCPQ